MQGHVVSRSGDVAGPGVGRGGRCGEAEEEHNPSVCARLSLIVAIPNVLRTLRLREGKAVAQGHTARKWQGLQARLQYTVSLLGRH